MSLIFNGNCFLNKMYYYYAQALFIIWWNSEDACTQSTLHDLDIGEWHPQGYWGHNKNRPYVAQNLLFKKKL